MQFYYSDLYDLSLPQGHRFPGHKYGMLRYYLLSEEILTEEMLVAAKPVAEEDLVRAHTPEYVQAIMTGTVEKTQMRRIGFPWTPQIPIRARATVGGALAAARQALTDGFSGQLAGGTHHAHRDYGSGYCVFNDFAVTALTLLEKGEVARIAIVDLDVHQGDGNAAILGARDDIFILSIHGEKNFPFRKVASTLDVGLPDGVEDEAYLNALRAALLSVWRFMPDLILYQAGVDPLSQDKLGRMALTFEGLKARDQLVLSGAQQRGIPISMAIGGGYADPIEASVIAYANTYRVAREIYGW